MRAPVAALFEGEALRGRWQRVAREDLRAGGADVYAITSAERGISDQQASRTRKYLISMSIRTACVIAAIFVPGWPRWVLIAGAVVLPYFAVVIANAGRENARRDTPPPMPIVTTPVLPPGPSPR